MDSTMELYESTAEELCEIRCKYSVKIRQYLSEITQNDLRRLKKMKFEKSSTGFPKTQVQFENKANFDDFSIRNGDGRNQCVELRNEITKLQEKLRRIKPEE